MKTEIKKLEDSKIEINVEIDSVSFEGVVKDIIEKTRKKITIPGFRKGGRTPPPENIVIQNVGEINILYEAAEEAINNSYRRIVEDNKIEPLGKPEISIIKIARKNPLIFKIIVSIFPEIKLPDYKKEDLFGLSKIEKREVVVDEKEIEQTLDYIRKSRAKLIKKFSAEAENFTLAEKGDFVEIEYMEENHKLQITNHKLKIKNNKGSDEHTDKEGKIKDKIILGQSGMLSDFEKEIIGMKKGEKKVFTIKISEKEIKTFNLELKDVKKVELPELNDDFVKTVGNFKNLEEFKLRLKEGIKREKEIAEKERICLEFLEKIREKSGIEVPEVLIKFEQERTFNNFKQNVEKEISFDDYLKKTKKTEGEILKLFEDQAKIRTLNFLILKEIAKNEKIEASQDEVEKRQKEIIQHYGLKKEDIDEGEIKKYAEEEIINQKTFDYIYSLY